VTRRIMSRISVVDALLKVLYIRCVCLWLCSATSYRLGRTAALRGESMAVALFSPATRSIPTPMAHILMLLINATTHLDPLLPRYIYLLLCRSWSTQWQP
jgi:hypothetical protein